MDLQAGLLPSRESQEEKAGMTKSYSNAVTNGKAGMRVR